ncbi:MAG TPA: type I-MYXAN CRISPR-associated protein Cas6/Cmx6 [bacterium]|nr:type I-MYXAN CRISPR-associated protein Cas6/Cmx6 [bacterium]
MPVVELSFPVRGTPLPVDNGYIVYRAVARAVPWVAAEAQVGLAIVPIQGNPHRGFLDLTPGSRLTFRVGAEALPMLEPLAGQCLVFGSATLILGQPTRSELRPAASLVSAFVVVEQCRYSDEVEEWLAAQFRALGIRAVPALRRKQVNEHAGPSDTGRPASGCPYVRRFRQIGETAVVGWEVLARGLSPEESLRLQELGVGPGRRMGCGVFVPERGAVGRSAPRRHSTGVWFPED